MKIALAQLNPTVGDIKTNLEIVSRTLERLESEGPDLVVFPEMFLTGYPPRDLLERNWFIERAEKGLLEVAKISEGCSCAILIGGVARSGRQFGRGLYNCAFGFYQGKEVYRQAKSLLPFYDVFDEVRYFDPAREVRLWDFKGERIGVSICEDAWNHLELWGKYRYDFDPIAEQARQGVTIFINIAASPFWLGKPELRLKLIKGHSERHKKPFVFVNQVGAQDELIFDGRGFATDAFGGLAFVLPEFEERVFVFESEGLRNWTGDRGPKTGHPSPACGLFYGSGIKDIYQALVLGIKDYFSKCGFKKAVIGLSGGIDSAVTACLAVRALGRDNVLGVTMPSEFSSKGSVDDSRLLSKNLGFEFLVIPITQVYHCYLDVLKNRFAGKAQDSTEENIQARIRGNILMALANKFRCIVLATGNKSELAVGYCTLYGDMSGGLAVLGDVPKMMVYQLAEYINQELEVIPKATIQKPPSAELKPNQKDQDTLPPYEILDPILEHYIEEGLSPGEIVKKGFDQKVVDWVVRQVARMEYKRQQAPVILRVTSRAFGTGRRFPIAARY